MIQNVQWSLTHFFLSNAPAYFNTVHFTIFLWQKTKCFRENVVQTESDGTDLSGCQADQEKLISIKQFKKKKKWNEDISREKKRNLTTG